MENNLVIFDVVAGGEGLINWQKRVFAELIGKEAGKGWCTNEEQDKPVEYGFYWMFHGDLYFLMDEFETYQVIVMGNSFAQPVCLA